MIKPGLYEHYKGLKYEVIGVCRHSETLEELVRHGEKPVRESGI